jgi:predicted  nucleic acid-binding Zn-ribbon protein
MTPADEDRLARLERTLADLHQRLEHGFAEGYKQFDALHRAHDQQAQHLQRELSSQAQQVHVRIDDLHRRFSDLQERLTGIEGRLGTLTPAWTPGCRAWMTG